MRVAVIGAGGVGGYFGGRLAAAGEEVTFVARGEHLRAIREAGLSVESVLGDFLVQPARATADPAEVGPVDLVLLGVKAWQVPEAAAMMPPLIGPETAVLPLQNGVEAADQVAAVVGRDHTFGGIAKIIAFVVGPGHVRHAGAEPTIVFGELDNRRTPRAERVLAALVGAGVQASIAPDVHAALWEKFLFIASVSGLGAVTRAPLGVVRENEETRGVLRQAMEEVEAVAAARGVQLPEDVVARTLDFVDSLPEEATASMQRDLMEGRPSELESQNGAVVRLGRVAGVPTPVHEVFYASLLPTERAARGA